MAIQGIKNFFSGMVNRQEETPADDQAVNLKKDSPWLKDSLISAKKGEEARKDSEFFNLNTPKKLAPELVEEVVQDKEYLDDVDPWVKKVEEYNKNKQKQVSVKKEQEPAPVKEPKAQSPKSVKDFFNVIIDWANYSPEENADDSVSPETPDGEEVSPTPEKELPSLNTLIRERYAESIDLLKKSGMSIAQIEWIINQCEALNEQQAKQLTAQLKRIFNEERNIHVKGVKDNLNGWSPLVASTIAAGIYAVGGIGSFSPAIQQHFGFNRDGLREFQTMFTNLGQAATSVGEWPKNRNQAYQSEHQAAKDILDRQDQTFRTQEEEAGRKKDQSIQKSMDAYQKLLELIRVMFSR